MARTAVTVNSLTAGGVLADPADTTADATNGHVVTPAVPLSEFFLRVTHTAASAKNFTLKAGDSPPADASGQGDLVQSFAAGNVTPVVKFIGPLSSARFIQNDGTVLIDLESGFTGTVGAFSVPRTA